MLRFLPQWLLVIALGLVTSLSFAALTGALDEKNIVDRIKPVGTVSIEEGSGQAAKKPALVATGDIGKQRYEQVCRTCHDSGLAGAPKLGDKSDWAQRLTTGMETLVNHAIHGYKAMPAKGTCMDCTDDEIKKTVEYMVSKSK